MLKGIWAEVKVNLVLWLLPSDYVVFNDIVIRSCGCSSQIDHLVVSPYGVFVVETKGHKGLIYGSEKAQYWTQNIWGHKYQLYNPLLQNSSHIRALQRVISIHDLKYIPILVFTNAANVSVTTNSHVITHWRLYFTIRSHKEAIITPEQIDQFVLS